MTEKLHELNASLSELQRRQEVNKMAYFEPYKKQLEFFANGVTKRERLFSSGNQCGKSISSAFEVAAHLTGVYPKWWPGRTFNHAVRSWCAGNTAEATRDTLQLLLLGPKADGVGGMIPPDSIEGRSTQRGVANCVDTITVRHKSGGTSSLTFKSYEKGRLKWQGSTLDFVALDEEPPADIYSEALARVAATKGCCWLTFTPLLGATEVVRKFYDDESPDRALTIMTIDDVDHFTDAERKQLISGYRPHEVEARTRGIPSMGSGAVYPVAQSGIEVEPFELPHYWPTIIGMDFGWQHPTVAAKLVYDRDNDTAYLTDIYKQSEATINQNAAAIRAKYGEAPTCWPHDGMVHDRSSGTPYAQLYRQAGVNMLDEPARYADGAGNSVEAGIADILDRMQSGRFKVFKHLEDFWTEMRQYHRDEKNGKVVKSYDDVLDAVRYAIMSVRHARIVKGGKRQRHRPRVARGMDYDLFGL